MPQRETAFDGRCFPLFILFKPSCPCLKKPNLISARSASEFFYTIPSFKLTTFPSICESDLKTGQRAIPTPEKTIGCKSNRRDALLKKPGPVSSIGLG